MNSYKISERTLQLLICEFLRDANYYSESTEEYKRLTGLKSIEERLSEIKEFEKVLDRDQIEVKVNEIWLRKQMINNQ